MSHLPLFPSTLGLLSKVLSAVLCHRRHVQPDDAGTGVARNDEPWRESVCGREGGGGGLNSHTLCIGESTTKSQRALNRRFSVVFTASYERYKYVSFVTLSILDVNDTKDKNDQKRAYFRHVFFAESRRP